LLENLVKLEPVNSKICKNSRVKHAICHLHKERERQEKKEKITRQGTPKGVDGRVDFFALWQRDCEMELDLGLFFLFFSPKQGACVLSLLPLLFIKVLFNYFSYFSSQSLANLYYFYCLNGVQKFNLV
jgi:hypothetical protein